MKLTGWPDLHTIEWLKPTARINCNTCVFCFRDVESVTYKCDWLSVTWEGDPCTNVCPSWKEIP